MFGLEPVGHGVPHRMQLGWAESGRGRGRALRPCGRFGQPRRGGRAGPAAGHQDAVATDRLGGGVQALLVRVHALALCVQVDGTDMQWLVQVTHPMGEQQQRLARALDLGLARRRLALQHEDGLAQRSHHVIGPRAGEAQQVAAALQGHVGIVRLLVAGFLAVQPALPVVAAHVIGHLGDARGRLQRRAFGVAAGGGVGVVLARRDALGAVGPDGSQRQRDVAQQGLDACLGGRALDEAGSDRRNRLVTIGAPGVGEQRQGQQGGGQRAAHGRSFSRSGLRSCPA
mmetsp:Transcript_6306/g.25531  ORF Transcript_6306/g.25531 Transcript_6306/m.25531 type:complete len:285 (+) Transcript_6306:321-1175(+)